MRTTIVVLAIILLATLSIAQTVSITPTVTLPTNLYGAGVSYSPGGSPAVAGTGIYARLLVDSGTYAFTVADVLPNTMKPFTVTTNMGVGIAQRIATIGTVPVYIPTSAGISYTGSNTGWSWTTGVMAVFDVKNHPNLKLMPNVRLAKSSVSNGTGYQPILGFLVGWGQ